MSDWLSPNPPDITNPLAVINKLMKIIVLLLFLLIGFNLGGQVDCNSNGLVLMTITDEIKSDSINRVKPTNLSLFSQIDLTGQTSISMMYGSALGDSIKLCYSTNIEVLQDLSDRHSDSEIIQNPSCAHTLPISFLTIVEGKTIIHNYRYNKNCNLLDTNCGTIEFNADLLLNICEEIRIKQENENFESEQNLLKRIDELSASKMVIFYTQKRQLVKEVIKVKFNDREDKVGGILSDDFWLDMIDEELLNIYKNPDDLKRNELELRQIGEILQKLIKQDLNNNGLKIINWRKNETGQYLITAESSSKTSLQSTSNSDVISESTHYKFELSYITFKEIR